MIGGPLTFLMWITLRAMASGVADDSAYAARVRTALEVNLRQALAALLTTEDRTLVHAVDIHRRWNQVAGYSRLLLSAKQNRAREVKATEGVGFRCPDVTGLLGRANRCCGVVGRGGI